MHNEIYNLRIVFESIVFHSSSKYISLMYINDGVNPNGYKLPSRMKKSCCYNLTEIEA